MGARAGARAVEEGFAQIGKMKKLEFGVLTRRENINEAREEFDVLNVPGEGRGIDIEIYSTRFFLGQGSDSEEEETNGDDTDDDTGIWLEREFLQSSSNTLLRPLCVNRL